MVVRTAVYFISAARYLHFLIEFQMLDSLKNPPEPFADVINTHFRLKARSIAKQLDDWLKKDDGKPTTGDAGEFAIRPTNSGSASSNGFQEDIDSLKKLLKEL